MKIKFNLLKTILLFVFISSNLYSQDTKNQVVEKDSLNGIFAEFETSKGTIIAKLDYKTAPTTVSNFITLAEGTNKYITDEKLRGIPFYDGLKFHIVIQDYMIESGDPTGLGKGGTGYTAFGEYSNDMKFEKGGYLAMDNSETEQNFSSKFLITHRKTEWYRGQKSVFGHVISSLDVVKSIRQNDTLIKVTIKRVGDDAKKFDAVKTFDDYFTIKKPIEDAKVAEMKLKAEEKAQKEKAQKEKALAEAKLIADEKSKIAKAEKIKYFEAMKTKAIKTPSGLKYVIIQKENGKKPIKGQTVYVYYAQYLTDATLTATNFEEVAKQYGSYNIEIAKRKGYNPFPYVLGQKDGLIPGILEGLSKMSFGDKILLFIPSNLGYGTAGLGTTIPPNTNLIFEIQISDSIPAK